MKKVALSSDLTFQSREEIKRRKQIKKRVFWIKFIVFFILITGSLILLAISPLFTIRSMEVSGNQHDRPEAILGVTKLMKGENGFKSIGTSPLNLLTLQDREAEASILKAFPYIRDVSVRFVLPDKIRVHVNERKPVGFIQFNGTSLLTDEEAYVLEAGGGVKTDGKLEIKGVKVNKFAVGQKLEMENPDAYSFLLKFMGEVQKLDKTETYKIFSDITSMDAGDEKNVWVNIKPHIRVNLGGLDELGYRLSFLRKILDGKINKSGKWQLDLTLDNPVLKEDK